MEHSFSCISSNKSPLGAGLSLLLKTVRCSPELNFVIRNRNFLCTKILKIDRRGPAQTGTDRRRPARTGADRCRLAQTGYFQSTQKICFYLDCYWMECSYTSRTYGCDFMLQFDIKDEIFLLVGQKLCHLSSLF